MNTDSAQDHPDVVVQPVNIPQASGNPVVDNSPQQPAVAPAAHAAGFFPVAVLQPAQAANLPVVNPQQPVRVAAANGSQG
jgi:hypothetical protein